MTIDECSHNFHELCTRCKTNEDDRMMVTCYRERLRSEIQDKLTVFDFTTIDAISGKVRRVEQVLRQQTGRHFSNQAGEQPFYRKGPDSTFNQAPQQVLRPPLGQLQN